MRFSPGTPLANALGNGVLGTARLPDAPFPGGRSCTSSSVGRNPPATPSNRPRTTEERRLRGGKYISAPDLHPLYRELANSARGPGASRAVSRCGIRFARGNPVRSNRSGGGPGNGGCHGRGHPGNALPGNAGVPPANGTARPPPSDAGERPAFPGRAVGVDARSRAGRRDEALRAQVRRGARPLPGRFARITGDPEWIGEFRKFPGNGLVVPYPLDVKYGLLWFGNGAPRAVSGCGGDASGLESHLFRGALRLGPSARPPAKLPPAVPAAGREAEPCPRTRDERSPPQSKCAGSESRPAHRTPGRRPRFAGRSADTLTRRPPPGAAPGALT